MKRLYALLLHLFPRGYREEYGDELQAVFNSSLEDAKKLGGMEIVKLWLRELIGLPGAVLYEHLRASRKAPGLYFEFSYGSWKEFLTALFPFLLVGGIWPLIEVLVRLGVWPGNGLVVNGIFLSLFGLFIILFIVGLTKGLPRWALPYLGFALSLLSVYVLSGIFGLFVILPFRKLYDRIEFLGDIAYGGIFWFGLLLGIISLVVMTNISPAFQRLRHDWTLPCFVVYGGMPFAVFLTFDEYAYDEPFMLLIFLILAVGAWLYLREGTKWKRFWTLFGGLTLSMFTVAVGKAILLPSQNWPFSISSALVVSEVKGTIFTWAWLALCMLVPLGSQFLSRSGRLSELSVSGR